jgi:hypothetical protein
VLGNSETKNRKQTPGAAAGRNQVEPILPISKNLTYCKDLPFRGRRE